MEAQLLEIDMDAYHQDYTNPFTGYSKADFDRCQVEAKEKQYSKQYQEYTKLLEETWLAYQVAKQLNLEAGLYYLQMHNWVLFRYDYLVKYGFTTSSLF